MILYEHNSDQDGWRRADRAQGLRGQSGLLHGKLQRAPVRRARDHGSLRAGQSFDVRGSGNLARASLSTESDGSDEAGPGAAGGDL
jgi:hypothetical protein